MTTSAAKYRCSWSFLMISPSKEGTFKHACYDARVFSFAETLDVPIAVTMAGGYGHDIDTTVDIHLETVRAAAISWQRRASRVCACG